jgi:transposase
VETNGAALIEAVRSTPGPRHLCMEEGTQSAWLYEVLGPVVAELIVTQQTRSVPGNKSDKLDAYGLATGLLKDTLPRRVYKAPRRFAKLRTLSHTYTKISRDLARCKNRLKSLYLSRGIQATGKSVYGPTREQWMQQLPASCRDAARLLYVQLDATKALKEDARQQMVRESHRHKISRILETCPGLAEVRVAQLIPTVITPHRFRTAQQYWAYCGFGIVMRTSSDWVRGPKGFERREVRGVRGLSHQSNRTLKEIYKSAVTTVLKNAEHPLTQHYERLLEAGTKPPNAKLTIARKIASLSLAMWRKEEAYDPGRITAHS